MVAVVTVALITVMRVAVVRIDGDCDHASNSKCCDGGHASIGGRKSSAVGCIASNVKACLIMAVNITK